MSILKTEGGTIALALALAGGGLCVFHAHPAVAADTLETFDPGATDVEFYMGADGLGAGEVHERAVYGEFLLGYGLMERFSAYFGTTLQGDGCLNDASAALYFGIFGTPIDTDHFGLDLILDVSAEGPDFEQIQFAPGFEMNFDLDPDMQSAGLYWRVGLPVYGREAASPGHLEEPGHDTAFHLESTLGMYVTLSDSEQFLIEFLAGVHPNPGPEEEMFDGAGVAIGYNVVLNDSIELITEVSAEIPHNGDAFTGGVMVGIIATLPGFVEP